MTTEEKKALLTDAETGVMYFEDGERAISDH